MSAAWAGGPSGRALGVLAGVLSVGLLVSGCKEVEDASAPVHQPAIVADVDGLDVKRVTFDQVGADRVALRTAEVRMTARGTVVPYAALIYDPAGAAWVYATLEPLTFQRVKVSVHHVTGNLVWLTDGPASGTRVVTRGSAQVYGAELDIAGGH